MWKKLPWQRVVRRAARAYGILDPATFLARVRRFAQPSEVQEPMELLRAGIIFHARGLVNTKAIQHNLDWVWPYWVERQFNPTDTSFIPRAFSFSHINLTHRNWTAVGLPELPIYPLVDPRGLVTPLHDGWSLDFWLLSDSGTLLLPSKEKNARQQLLLGGKHRILTAVANEAGSVEQQTEVILRDGQPELHIKIHAGAEGTSGWLATTIRPYNPEGVQFIDELRWDEDRYCWRVNDKTDVYFDTHPSGLRTSHYEKGDVYHNILESHNSSEVKCPVGLATAASLYRLEPDKAFHLTVTVPLHDELRELSNSSSVPPKTWCEAESEASALQVPDGTLQFLYDSAVHTMYQLSAEEIYPGVYTYRRFWFRDACLMLNALLGLGLTSRCRRIIEKFPQRQHRDGYFCSQEGEWDSNGQVLWILERYSRMAAELPSASLLKAAAKAVAWLEKKRIPAGSQKGYPGLLPAGFSAEHLGTNDYYYWDDFWAVGGLRAVAHTFERAKQNQDAEKARRLADEFLQSIENSLQDRPIHRREQGLPAAPGRRMDSGAVGSLVADYPLQLFPPGDKRILRTIDYLMEHSFQRGAFFQEMIHSGINAYLTLDIAQSLLRAGDTRYADLIRTVASLATDTGQWPEAIHPQSLGGCMGDGQHGWAAGEWILMMRSCFIREEEDKLIFCSGLLPEWLEADEELAFGPTATPWGNVSVKLIPRANTYLVSLDAHWHSNAPAGLLRLPGCDEVIIRDYHHTYEIPKPASTTPSDNSSPGEPSEMSKSPSRFS